MIKSLEPISREKAIAKIWGMCSSIEFCEDCPNDLYCESLRKRGHYPFEKMTDYQLQHIITELEKVN